MGKAKLTSVEKQMAKSCYCPECGHEYVKCPSGAGAMCPEFTWKRCGNGTIKTWITDKHFKALKRVKHWQEQAIDSDPQN